MSRDMKLETPKSLTELVIERLEQAIVDGEFGLGESISEEMLAKSFGVSRTPVRDALTYLQRTGLVTVLPKRGSFVFAPTIEDTAALCEYRYMLERDAVTLCLARARDATRAALQASITAMEKARIADAVAYGRADTDFHRAFFNHCGNTYLADAYRLASGKVAALRTHLTATMLDRRNTSLAEHKAIAKKFTAGDRGGLIKLLETHIDRTRLVYVEALSSPKPEGRRLALAGTAAARAT